MCQTKVKIQYMLIFPCYTYKSPDGLGILCFELFFLLKNITNVTVFLHINMHFCRYDVYMSDTKQIQTWILYHPLFQRLQLILKLWAYQKRKWDLFKRQNTRVGSVLFNPYFHIWLKGMFTLAFLFLLIFDIYYFSSLLITLKYPHLSK